MLDNPKSNTVRVPGKLYIAGEYAVVEGAPAIIVAVDHFLKVKIRSSLDGGRLCSSLQPDLDFIWVRQSHGPVINQPHPYALVESAMQVAEAYLTAKHVKLSSTYRLDITSDLDHGEKGIKYGLGSSGAVTVGVIRAILAYFELRPDPITIYKLAVLAQTKLNLKGSFGDLAASSFGGWIAYCRPNRTWLLGEMAELSLLALVEADWPDLLIQPLTLPEELDLLAGWTQSAASTEDLVTQMTEQARQVDKAKHHQQFLIRSRACLEDVIAAFEVGDCPAILAGIRHNRLLLREYSQAVGLVIETPALTRLIEVAEQVGAAAKTSGAGGGDCGICLVSKPEHAKAIRSAWLAVGILPLPLNPTTIPDIEEG